MDSFTSGLNNKQSEQVRKIVKEEIAAESLKYDNPEFFKPTDESRPANPVPKPKTAKKPSKKK